MGVMWGAGVHCNTSIRCNLLQRLNMLLLNCSVGWITVVKCPVSDGIPYHISRQTKLVHRPSVLVGMC